jgi:hypothetical protein
MEEWRVIRPDWVTLDDQGQTMSPRAFLPLIWLVARSVWQKTTPAAEDSHFRQCTRQNRPVPVPERGAPQWMTPEANAEVLAGDPAYLVDIVD